MRKSKKTVPIHRAKAVPVHHFDRMHHTDTGGLIERTDLLTGHENDAHVTAYYGIAPSILTSLIDLWQGTRPSHSIDRYTFLDLGAGKGRAMMTASLHPFLEVVGIELNPTLAAIARINLEVFPNHASPLAPTRLTEGDVLTAPLPATPTLAFMFHPFEAPVLRKLIYKAEEHYRRLSLSFDLLYVNAEHAVVLDQRETLSRLFRGLVPMSSADHLADLAEIAQQTEYGSTGDELCGIYRLNHHR